ncbi:PP5, partial [Symbiodinium pilosum]
MHTEQECKQAKEQESRSITQRRAAANMPTAPPAFDDYPKVNDHAAVDEAPRQEEKWETDTRMIIDFLWSDPRGGAGYGPSYRKSRGVFMFGPDVSDQFIRENNLKLVIRSHEVKAEGYLQDHPSLMSVFSAPNYLDTGGNKGAFLQLSPGPDGNIQVTPTSFMAVPHPDLPPMYHQNYIAENHPHLTRQMKKKQVAQADDFGDSDFAGYQ